MEVRIECFKTLKDLQNNSNYRKGNGKAGVYVWGFSLGANFTVPTSPQMFFPYYVGKSESDLYSRTHEHIATLAGGNFSIFDVLKCVTNNTNIGKVHRDYQNESKKAGTNGGPILPNSRFSNMLYFPEGVHRQYDFFFNKSISNQIDWMLNHFCILYIIPTSGKSNISTLEKKIGKIIGYDILNTKEYKNVPEDFKVEIVDNSEVFQLNKYEDLFTFCQKT